jgi:hypothetical protein
MTEAQKTEMALLKAKAEKTQTGKIEKATKIAKNTPNTPNTPNTEPKEINKTKYPFEVELGDNKTVHFKAWTGKTKKKFKKLFQNLEDIEELDLKQVIQVLIYDQISETDMYLSDNEQQYLMAMLYKLSLSDNITFFADCENCGENQLIKTQLSDAVNYTKSKYPFIEDDLTINDIDKKSILDNYIKNIMFSDSYDGLTTEKDIEIALHLKIGEVTDPLEILNLMDEMDLKTLTDILQKLDNTQPQFKIEVVKKCKECQKNSKFGTEEIPGLYESLIG